jgi:hypothetical protein
MAQHLSNKSKKSLAIFAQAIMAILGFIAVIVSLLFTFFLFDLIKYNSHLVFIYRESIPDVKLGFIGFMIFTGLHFFSVLLTIFFKGD